MPIATRTFRVFVSSTFEDLKAERDALQRDVFPKLRKLCEQHGTRFQAIDLRWGVRDEAALDQQTMAICLREIQRCKATGVRPNFIALLGDRYGWRPLPVTIPASEFEVLKPHHSVRDAGVALQWYRLDENAVPPEYCLQPRTGEFVEASAWNPVEESLLQALATAARAAGLSDKELVKYEASATHQEILAGLGDSEEDRQHVFGFARRPTGSTDPRVEDLKSQLRIREFDAGDMKVLCDLVLTQLTDVIEAEVKRFEDQLALDLEMEAHDRFADDRCRIFVGREFVLETIADYIRGPERRPLVLYGESGSGKSAVMAKASQKYQHKDQGRVIRRFIGASSESASGHALLTSLCKQIESGETPVDYAQLEDAFRKRLSGATSEQPLVLFIDALDQMAANDPAREVTWLPAELPANVKVILSTTEGGGQLPEGVPVRLERMAQQEAGQALDDLLQEAHRKLQPRQRETALAHFNRCGLPLYLKLAAEESRLWRSYTPENACTLGEGVAGIIDTLFDRLSGNASHGPTLLERSLGYLAAARYGLTENEVLDVLAADDAVWSDFDQRKHHEVSERSLPVVVWSRLSLDLEPYLSERAAPGGTVIAFYHRQLAERVAVRFLAEAESQARHNDLARYFSERSAWLDAARKVPDTRRAVEFVFQQRGAQLWTGAEVTLFDCQFLFGKVAANLVLDLDADYQTLLQEAPQSLLPRGDALKLIRGAVLLSIHVVAQDPAQFASQIVGRLLALRDRPDVQKFADDITAAAPRPWIRPLHPCLDSAGGPLLRTLAGHSNRVLGVAVTPDGKRAVSASFDRTLKVWDLETGLALRTLEGHSSPVTGVAVTPDGKRAVSASWDKTLKLWDLETGRTLRTLEGHSDWVTNVAVTPDGGRAVSASKDKTLKVWDLETGRALPSLQGHSESVTSVAVTPDGKRAVSASEDKTLKVWDLETGRTLRTMEGHAPDVPVVAVTPDGKRAISVSGNSVGVCTLKVWDLETGAKLRTLEGHSWSVNGAAVTPDGKRAISASDSRILNVWDIDSGREVFLEGHSDYVMGVAVTPDGKRAVSASNDNTLKVWDLETSRALRTLAGHSDIVRGVAVTPDGKRAISASEDRTLKVWNLDTGGELRTLEGHSLSVTGVAVTADGKRVVSASWDKTLKVWDLDKGCELRTLEGHSDAVYGVAVTADGKRAVSASRDKTLKVWDLDKGLVIATFHCDAGARCCAFADERRIVAGDQRGRVYFLALEEQATLLSPSTASAVVRPQPSAIGSAGALRFLAIGISFATVAIAIWLLKISLWFMIISGPLVVVGVFVAAVALFPGLADRIAAKAIEMKGD